MFGIGMEFISMVLLQVAIHMEVECGSFIVRHYVWAAGAFEGETIGIHNTVQYNTVW